MANRSSAQLFNVKRNPVMEKDTITSIFNKLEILNFFYLRMSLSKAGKKSVNRLSSIQKGKKNPQYLSRSTAITRKKWMLIKTVCRALHFHTDKYKHTLVYKGTRDAFLVRKLQGWKAAADATERVDRLKVKSVSGIFQLEKLLPSTCCGKYVAMQLLQTFRLYFKKTKDSSHLPC